jgi:hypothetical protein
MAIAFTTALAGFAAMAAPAWADAYVGAQPPQVSGLQTGAPRIAATHVLGQHFSRGASGPTWLAFTGMVLGLLVAVGLLAIVIGGRLRQVGRSQPR